MRGPDLGPLAPWLDTLACQITRVSLGPLSPAESLELLRHHLAGRGDAELETMAHDSAGHPYLLRELALATDDRATSGPPRVDDVLRDRAARLAPLERTVLDLVCAATAPIGPRVVGAAAGIGPGDLAAITAALVRQRWAVVTPGDHDGSIWPAHDRVRVALRAALDEPARRELARRLAEAIEANAGADVESLALQWSEAGDYPRAARFARLAGDRAMEKLAFERAADLYDSRAARHLARHRARRGPDRHGRRARRRRRAAPMRPRPTCAPPRSSTVPRPTIWCCAPPISSSGRGRSPRASSSSPASSTGSTSACPDLRRRRCAWCSFAGSRSACAAVAPRALSDEQRRGLVRRIDACWVAGDLLVALDPLRATVLHLQGLLLALDAGEPYRLARSLCTAAAWPPSRGGRTDAPSCARLAFAERMCKQVGSPQLDGYLALSNGIVQLRMGDFDDAQRHLDRAEATFERCPGAHWEIGHARELALWTLAYRGRLPELTQRLTAAVALCTARGDRVGTFKLLVGPSHVVLLARDESHQLLDACRMELLGLSPDEYSFLAFCALFGRVNAFLYLGRSRGRARHPRRGALGAPGRAHDVLPAPPRGAGLPARPRRPGAGQRVHGRRSRAPHRDDAQVRTRAPVRAGRVGRRARRDPRGQPLPPRRAPRARHRRVACGRGAARGGRARRLRERRAVAAPARPRPRR